MEERGEEEVGETRGGREGGRGRERNIDMRDELNGCLLHAP